VSGYAFLYFMEFDRQIANTCILLKGREAGVGVQGLKILGGMLWRRLNYHIEVRQKVRRLKERWKLKVYKTDHNFFCRNNNFSRCSGVRLVITFTFYCTQPYNGWFLLMQALFWYITHFFLSVVLWHNSAHIGVQNRPLFMLVYSEDLLVVWCLNLVWLDHS